MIYSCPGGSPTAEECLRGWSDALDEAGVTENRRFEFTVPSLTTVSIPFADLSAVAIRLPVEQIEERADAERSPTAIAVRLVQRRSCGCPYRQAEPA